MDRSYGAAVAALNSLQSNFAIVDAIRKSGRDAKNKQSIPEMVEWCHKLGYEPAQFDEFRPIHISGTKGKGSTSAFISSILNQYVHSPQAAGKLHKIGLYTSPHLRFVRERIQINNEPLSASSFAKYCFELWDRYNDAARKGGLGPDTPETRPMYFRYLTLMAFHTYIQEKVDSAIIECGVGGEYDCTNILVSPTATAITSLGIDHVSMLGGTIEEIAWHKSGIYKSGAYAFTVPQPEAAMRVLRERAAEKDVELTVVERHPALEQITLGLSGDFQKINASLAIAVAAAHLRTLGFEGLPDPTAVQLSKLPPEFRRGLEQVRWPGRCESRRDPECNIMWHLDGGHTLESIDMAGKWFADQVGLSDKNVSTSASNRLRVLIFNQQTRKADALAQALHTTLAAALGEEKPFTHAIFCTNITYKDSGYKPDLVSINTNSADVDALTVQKALAATWNELDPQTDVKVVRTIQEAIENARDIAQASDAEVFALITGSLHLVGGAIDVLEDGKN